MSHSIEQKLPEELLDHIVTSTTHDTLRSLCLTSKIFNRLATPRLYSSIVVKETLHLPALAYLAFTSPAHATLIKSLIVPNTWSEREERNKDWSWPTPEDPNHEEVLKARCAEYASSDEEAEDMYEKIQSGGNDDAILAMLLASLPKLRKLDISFGCGAEHADFVVMWPAIVENLRRKGETPEASSNRTDDVPRSTPLSTPLDMMVKGEDTKYPNDPDHLAIFFNMPNLRSIYAFRFGDEYEPNPPNNPFLELKERSCPVEYIELRTSKLASENLRLLLGATIPGKLKTFIYEIGCTWAWVDVHHSVIMQILQPHLYTLESLCLSHEEFYPYLSTGEEVDKPYPCSFTPFIALKRFKVAPVYIWGHSGFTDSAKLARPDAKDMLWKSLPGSLEELWITRAEHQKVEGQDAATEFVPNCLIPALELVALNKKQAFPNLKHLCIELPPFVWTNDWFDRLASVCATAAAHDIHCTIIFCDLIDRYGHLTVEKLWGWNEDVWWEPSRYSCNGESPKMWIDAASHEDLAQRLKDLKEKVEGENKRYKEAKREVNARKGELCAECEADPVWDIQTHFARWQREVGRVLEGCEKKRILEKVG
jgi:hypothetical protein